MKLSLPFCAVILDFVLAHLGATNVVADHSVDRETGE